MKIETEYPFEEYTGYLVLNKENRKHVCLVKKDHRTTISYARYLMSINLKRKMGRNEQVDHIDEDKTNDNIDNLQILTARENCRKHILKTGKSLKMVSISCPNCNTIFERSERNTFLSKRGRYTCCSRNCGYDFLKKGYSLEEMSIIGSKSIVLRYRL